MGFRGVTKSSESLCVVKTVCLGLCEDALNEEKQKISVGILLIIESCSHRHPVVLSGANTQANTY